MYADMSQVLLLSRLASMGFEDHRQAVKERKQDHHVVHLPNGRPKPHPRAGIDAVVIHATATIRRQDRPTSRFDSVDAHFVVLKRGRVLYLHDIEEYLNASHAFNARSIAIEHELKPPSEKADSLKRVGKDRDLPTREQILASRLLLRTLKESLPHLRFVYGHKQAANKLCPGPHLWYNVLYWAERNLDLTCGGIDYSERNAFGTGQRIPQVWYDPKFDLMGEAAELDAARTASLVAAALRANFPLP